MKEEKILTLAENRVIGHCKTCSLHRFTRNCVGDWGLPVHLQCWMQGCLDTW